MTEVFDSKPDIEIFKIIIEKKDENKKEELQMGD